ncbi:MAG TPA: peptide ABC transporter substrate-binding protein [Ktedonobacteraceae bacterium]|nr:peptide ABC transporter substrate-binding protein [Ktedonobacteraceae bacterium]
MRSGKKFTIGFLPTLLCLVAMLLASCGSSTTPGNTGSNKPAKAPASQQIYRYGDAIGAADIATFDPGQATDAPSIEAIDMAFTGLVALNDNLQVVPQLAAALPTVSSDGLTWTFKLKPNLHFSDGSTLTSQDVVYSIDRALSPQISSLNGVSLTYLGLIQDSDKRVNGKISTLIGDSLLTPDPNTVVIKVNKETGYFLEALSYPTAYVVEKSVIDKWGLKWTDHLADNGGQGGAGPFKVKSYSHTTGIVFVPNTFYYNAKPQLQEVDFDFYKTAESAYAAYQANQVDITSVPAEDIQVARTKTKEYGQQPELTIDYFAMNYLYKPFDNIDIRQAFELAINKDAIMNALYHGTRPATCHIIPQGMPGYYAGLKCPGGASTSGNPSLAKQLLQQGMQQEGWTSVSQIPPIKITFESNAATLQNEITEVRQEIQTVLGITVQTQIVDFPTLLTDVTNTLCTKPDYHSCLNQGLQMWELGWIADYPDPQDWTTLQFDKGAPNNDWNYGQNGSTDAAQQVQTQQLLEQADVTLDQTKRIQMYNQAEQQLVNDVAWLPMDQRFGTHLLKTYVIGRVFNAQAIVPADDWANVYIAVH